MPTKNINFELATWKHSRLPAQFALQPAPFLMTNYKSNPSPLPRHTPQLQTMPAVHVFGLLLTTSLIWVLHLVSFHTTHTRRIPPSTNKKPVIFIVELLWTPSLYNTCVARKIVTSEHTHTYNKTLLIGLSTHHDDHQSTNKNSDICCGISMASLLQPHVSRQEKIATSETEYLPNVHGGYQVPHLLQINWPEPS